MCNTRSRQPRRSASIAAWSVQGHEAARGLVDADHHHQPFAWRGSRRLDGGLRGSAGRADRLAPVRARSLPACSSARSAPRSPPTPKAWSWWYGCRPGHRHPSGRACRSSSASTAPLPVRPPLRVAGEAELRGVPLLVVHASTAHGEDPEPDPILDAAVEQARGTSVLTVRGRSVQGDARRVLLDASCRAAALVVGSRGRGGIAGLRLSLVSQAIMRHAHCPCL